MLKVRAHACVFVFCFLQAAFLFSADNLDELRREAEAAIERDASDYRAYSKRAYTEYMRSRFAEAEKDYKKALSYAPREAHGDLLYNLGNTYFMQNKLNEALEIWRTGLRQNPGDSDMIYNYAVARTLLDRENQQGENDDKSKDEQSGQGDNKDGQNKQPDQNEEKQDQQKKDPSESDKKKEEAKRQPGEMSEEEALRLLRAIQDQERESSAKDKVIISGVRRDKDW